MVRPTVHTDTATLLKPYRRNFKTTTLHSSVDGKYFKNGAFQKR